MKTVTLIISAPPYGSEGPYNALRLALTLSLAAKVRLFLLGDGVWCAKRHQQPPAGHAKLEEMLGQALSREVQVIACGTCCGERGLGEDEVIPGVHLGTMEDLAEWILTSDSALSV